MPAKTKPSKAKTHTNPKGRVAFFCYVTNAKLAEIKRNVDRKNPALRSQGHVVCAMVLPKDQLYGVMKRPIA
jgi:hypothetical protein